MAKYYHRKKVLLAKIESTYGTDSTPEGATNAILTRNLEIDPIEGEELQRELDKGTMGKGSGQKASKPATGKGSKE